MRTRSYADLIVWERSLSLTEELYRLSSLLPRDERFGIIAQLRRAVVSTCANIAEGYGRRTRGEFVNQLSIARGSVTEVSALLRICERLGFVTSEEVKRAQGLTDEVGAMLWRMMERLDPKGAQP
jgi:four helix bundle protein